LAGTWEVHFYGDSKGLLKQMQGQSSGQAPRLTQIYKCIGVNI